METDFLSRSYLLFPCNGTASTPNLVTSTGPGIGKCSQPIEAKQAEVALNCGSANESLMAATVHSAQILLQFPFLNKLADRSYTFIAASATDVLALKQEK